MHTYQFIVKSLSHEEKVKVEASYLKEALDELRAIIVSKELEVISIKHYENQVMFNVNVAFLNL
jgi:hypothetical protein